VIAGNTTKDILVAIFLPHPVVLRLFGEHLFDVVWSGGSLDKHRNIPEHILGPISVSIVRGLQYLWSLKIMHRGNNNNNTLHLALTVWADDLYQILCYVNL